MDRTAGSRWYTHGWNRGLSWKLILGIIPRVPPFLRPPLHLIATLVCIASMGHERRAARRNLGRILGLAHPAGLLDAFRLFYNFSKFMVAYVELPPYGNGVLEPRLAGREETRDRLHHELRHGRGVIVMGMHLGQWDLALVALARLGVDVTVVMRREEEESARFAQVTRSAAGVRVVHSGESRWLMVELLSVLRRNGVVAVQGDRLFGDEGVPVNLFGAPIRIPRGPIHLARASGAPILPSALVFDGHRHYRLKNGRSVDVASAPPETGEREWAQMAATAMEEMIRENPYQWFNFFDVWTPRDGGREAFERTAERAEVPHA